MNYPFLSMSGATLRLAVYAQPGGKKSEILGIHGERLKIRLQAPPIEGRANEALIDFVAKFFAISPSRVELKSGQKSRAKMLEIQGLALAEASSRLQSVMK